jgi:Gamma-glutamyl cyclotransferase, AIG2-like
VVVRCFAYGTTQKGFTHWRRLGLGEPIARVRTVEPHAVVVPRRAGCSNPGCEYVHRMAALVPGLGGSAEGDLFELGEDAAASVDALETGPGSPYVRGEVEGWGGGAVVRARAYLAAEPGRWRALVARGEADALEHYPPALADAGTLKDCCVREPGHTPPHDVIEVLS